MNAWINVSAFDIESIGHNLDIFLRWKNAVLQMLEHVFRRKDCYQKVCLGSQLMTKNLQSSHEVLDSDLGYYMQKFLVQ